MYQFLSAIISADDHHTIWSLLSDILSLKNGVYDNLTLSRLQNDTWMTTRQPGKRAKSSSEGNVVWLQHTELSAGHLGHSPNILSEDPAAQTPESKQSISPCMGSFCSKQRGPNQCSRATCPAGFPCHLCRTLQRLSQVIMCVHRGTVTWKTCRVGSSGGPEHFMLPATVPVAVGPSALVWRVSSPCKTRTR